MQSRNFQLDLCTLILFINSDFNFLNKTPIHSRTVVKSQKGSLRFTGNFGMRVKVFQFFCVLKTVFAF